MPIYEYECDSCDNNFEKLILFGDVEPTECEFDDCNGRVHRVISESSFHLKGSGWYATDYASPNVKSDNISKPSSTTTTSNE